jgi:hypothetical protein
MAVNLGTRNFTKVVAKSEAAFGTPATFNDAAGELLFLDVVGAVDQGKTLDLGDDKSAAIRAIRIANQATLTGIQPVVSFGAANISMRNLPLFFDGLSSITPSGAGPYQWAYTPSMTDLDTLKTYSLFVQDGYKSYIVDGCTPSEITISADASGLLQGGITYNARNIAETANVSTAAISTQPFLPGRLFGLSTKSTFMVKAGTGGTAYTNHLTSWSLTLTPGAAPLQAMSGSLNYGGVAYTSAMNGTLELTISSNSTAATIFPYDSIGTQKFIRLAGVDAAGYGLTILASCVVESVSVIGSDSDGLILNTATLQLAYDTTSTKTIEVYVDSPLSARP